MKQVSLSALIFMTILFAQPISARYDKSVDIRVRNYGNEAERQSAHQWSVLAEFSSCLKDIDKNELSPLNRLDHLLRASDSVILKNDVLEAFEYAKSFIMEYSDQISNDQMQHITAIMHRVPFIFSHIFGSDNTFVGIDSGNFVLTGSQNSGFGKHTLTSLTSGQQNTAVGFIALNATTSGVQNTAIGAGAMELNTTGFDNSAIGYQALNSNTTGDSNTALGRRALLFNTTGIGNIGIGDGGGSNLTTGSANIDIGNAGVAAESNTIRIGSAQTRNFQAGIEGVTPAGAPATWLPVIIDGSDQLGTYQFAEWANGAITGPPGPEMTFVVENVFQPLAFTATNPSAHISFPAPTDIQLTGIGIYTFVINFYVRQITAPGTFGEVAWQTALDNAGFPGLEYLSSYIMYPSDILTPEFFMHQLVAIYRKTTAAPEIFNVYIKAQRMPGNVGAAVFAVPSSDVQIEYTPLPV